MKNKTDYQFINNSKQTYPLIVLVALGLYGLIFFNQVLAPGWMPVGDSGNAVAWVSYQFSSFARGEFPLWDPTVMAGNTSFIAQAILLGPIANIVIFTSVLLGLNDIVLAYAIWVYVLIVIYVVGVYLLIFLWTKNRGPACYGAIVTLFSSSVFLAHFQITYLMIIYCVPLIIYSSIRYFEKFKFKYLICFLLAVIPFLYSYEFVMPLSYLLLLVVTGVVFYYKSINIKSLIKIPTFHIIFSMLTLAIAVLPQALVYFDMMSGFSLPSENRVEGEEFKITKDYKVDYKVAIEPKSAIENFLTCENCWVGAFTGTYFKPNDRSEASMWSTLRYYIGPVTLPFIIVALFSLSRKVWCVFSAGALTALLAGYVFPLNLITKLPIFNLMHALNNLNHYFLLTLIILSAFGFNSIVQQSSKFTERILIGTSLFFMMGCISLPFLFQLFFSDKGSFYFGGNEIYIRTLLISAIFAMASLLILQYLKKKSGFAWQVSVILLTIILGFWNNSLILKQHKFLQGGVADDQNILALRNRTDHKLQFRFVRPQNMEIGVSTTEGKEINPILQLSPEKVFLYSYLSSNYSSFTMRDNSYNHPLLNSGFPIPRSFFKFRSIPGNERFLEKKFFLLPQIFISSNEADMGVFLDQPNLLTDFFNKGIGVANATKAMNNLGSFNLSNVATLPEDLKKQVLNVDVLEYKANSMSFKVFSKTPGMFVYTDLWHKDWNVTVDRELVPLRKIFHTFKGVELERGTHEVRFYFKSDIEFLFKLVSVIFFVLIIVLISIVMYEQGIRGVKLNPKKIS